MRLDYVPNPPTDLSPEDQEVLERVKARRGSMGLIPLDLTLLHAPKVADGSSFQFALPLARCAEMLTRISILQAGMLY